MVKALRIIAGLLLIALFLYAANLAVQDCPAGAATHDNCLWLWLRGRFGLPPSKFARAVALELVGLGLLAGIVLTIRFVFPFRGSARASDEASR